MLLTVAQAAAKLNASPSFVRALVRRGKLAALVDGRFVRIAPEAVDEYLAAHTNPAGDKAAAPSPPPARPRKTVTPPPPGRVHLR